MKPLVVVLGATGTGKSKLAMEIAARFNGEIISADSMQVYQGLDIVTNKVTAEERSQCPHHMIDVISPLCSNFTVTDFRNMSLQHMENIWHCQKLPIIVGGTNYYIESLLYDFLLDTGWSGSHSPLMAKGSCQLPIDGKADSATEGQRLGNDSLDVTESTSSLLQRLRDVDPASARQIHPKDRRKILRALQVYEKTGQTRSEHLEYQHLGTGSVAVSGPLRFTDTCMIWIQCDQEVLDSRLRVRVDKMIDEGLISEMLNFHHEYNQQQVVDGQYRDYTLGIFQSIGFKEFHEFLILPDAAKKSEEGQILLQQGIETMKIATCRYARRQLKWITNRFVKRKGADVPPIYALDATNEVDWETNVTKPAFDIVSSFLEDRPSPFVALQSEAGVDDQIYMECHDCGVVAVTKTNWDAHVRGHRHKKTVERRHRLERLRQQHGGSDISGTDAGQHECNSSVSSSSDTDDYLMTTDCLNDVTDNCCVAENLVDKS